MRKNAMFPACVRGAFLGCFLTFTGVGVAWAVQESTVFSFDGQDFIREKTTLMTEDGKSAVNTKLDRNSAAYKSLVKKISYSGQAALFGQMCDSVYAPVTDPSGKLTGALFVATCDE